MSDTSSAASPSLAANPLLAFSDALGAAASSAAASLVRVDDGSRLTACGVVWSDGVIVTTSHGTERDEDLAIVTGDGRRVVAALVGRDLDTDLAVLRADTDGLSPIERRAGVDAPAIGTLVLAVARAGDYGPSATLGVVSGVQMTQTQGHDEYIVATDADLFPGASGGALIGVDGKLIGVLDRLFGRGAGVALGAPLVERVVQTVLTHGRVPRGYLGVRSQRVALPDTLRVAHSLAQDHGLMVLQVEPNTTADTAGVTLGDTLVALNNAPINDIDDLRSHLRVGETVTMTVLRGGQIATLTGTVGAAPA